MALVRVRHQAGGSATQFVVILLLLGVFIAVASQRIWQLRETAERVGVEQVVGTIRSTLGIRMATVAIERGASGLAALEGGNPMQLLQQEQLPWNYLGEGDTLDPHEIPEHHWYFDRQRQILIYRLMFSDGFSSPLAGPPRIRLRLAMSYDDRNGNGRFDAESERLRSLSLESLEPYRWGGRGDERSSAAL